MDTPEQIIEKESVCYEWITKFLVYFRQEVVLSGFDVAVELRVVNAVQKMGTLKSNYILLFISYNFT